jgi:hypothetical protein
MNEGTYLVQVIVNGNLIPSYQYVYGVNNAQLTVYFGIILFISFYFKHIFFIGIRSIYSQNK